MKKILLTSAFVAASLFANSGEAVYKAKCMMCHKIIDKSAMKAKMAKLSPQERKAYKQKMMQQMGAPPMNKVSARLKVFYPNKEEFVAFVKDYITNPDAKKAHCMPMALKRFGVMPPIGKSMSKADKEAVATWLYTNFHEQWQEMKSCAVGGKKAMKCGAGKCGGGMKKPAMKCGPGKCGM